MGSSELGSDALGKTQNTWKPPDQSSLHNVCRTRSSHKPMQNFYFFKGYLFRRQQRSKYRPEAVGHHWPARPERALEERDSVRTGFGGAERDRTADPLLAKQVLSQLSYSPNHRKHLTANRQDQVNPNKPQFATANLICWCKWWAREDLNFRPHAYQACALTN
jgi:hypothetical protein